MSRQLDMRSDFIHASHLIASHRARECEASRRMSARDRQLEKSPPAVCSLRYERVCVCKSSTSGARELRVARVRGAAVAAVARPLRKTVAHRTAPRGEQSHRIASRPLESSRVEFKNNEFSASASTSASASASGIGARGIGFVSSAVH